MYIFVHNVFKEKQQWRCLIRLKQLNNLTDGIHPFEKHSHVD